MKKIVLGVILFCLAIGAGVFLIQKRPETPVTQTLPGEGDRVYHIEASHEPFMAEAPGKYTFVIQGANGEVVKDFALTHTERLHVIVVRKDLAHFLHLHPTFDPGTGLFTLNNMTFPADGTYRVFADFSIAHRAGEIQPVTIFEDILVGLAGDAQAIGSEERQKTFGPYEVELLTSEALAAGRDVTLTFNLRQDNRPVKDLETYLGALGHAVILRQDTLDFIHAHPIEQGTQDGKVSFAVKFPTPGLYKIFTQFQRENQVFLTDFVVAVNEGDASTGSVEGSHTVH